MFASIGRGILAIGRFLPILFRDLAGLCAAAAITYGAWMLHPAAGYIVGGTLVLAGVILSSLSSLLAKKGG